MTRARTTNPSPGVLLLLPLLLLGGGPLGCGDSAARHPAPDPTVLGTEPRRVSSPGVAADHPDVAVDGHGVPWVVYVEFEDRRTRVMVRPVTERGRAPAVRLSPDGTDVSSPRIAWNGAGFCVVWTAVAEGGCRLVHVDLDEAGEPRAAPRAIDAGSPEVEPVLASNRAGRVALASIGKREGRRVILLRDHGEAGFGAPVAVSDPTKNAYSPDVALDGTTTWVAWDTMGEESFDVVLARVDGDRVAQRTVIADSPLFEAHPSLAVAPGGRVYVAYDQGDEDWGRGRARFSMAATLHLRRAAALRALDGGDLIQPERPLGSFLPRPCRMVHEYPRVFTDADGNLVLTLRTFPTRNPLEKDERSVWANLVFGKERVFELKYSTGRNDVRPRFARSEAAVFAVWHTDRRAIHRSRGEWFAPPTRDGRQGVYVGVISPSGASAFDAGPWRRAESTEPASGLASLDALEATPPWRTESPPSNAGRRRTGQPARAYEAWPVEHRGETLEAYFGDLHRHTDISRCWMNKDGSLKDVLRYALDVGRLDFLAVTNHPAHMTSWDRRRAEQAVDEQFVDGTLVTFFGYEHVEPRGHKNVVFQHRADARMVSFAASEERPDRDDARTSDPGEFLDALRGSGALVIPHTPAGQGPNDRYGTDWSYHVPEVQRLVEIFQGYRGSYEDEGEPRAFPVPNHPGGFVRKALARGLRLGFVASSDHQATEMGYAGVVAAKKTREAIFAALLARHTFAATARIALFVDSEDGMMGDVVPYRDDLSLRVRARCTAPAATLEVVSDDEVLERVDLSGEKDVDRTIDVALRSGAQYLYTRLIQVDGEIAWSSPFFFE